MLTAAYQVVEAQEMGSSLRGGGDALSGRRLLAFAGLGSPRGFAETLTAAGVRVAALVEYPDHYWFAQGDLDDLAQQARAMGAEGLITTQKDWVRLRERGLPLIPLWVLSVRLRLEPDRGALRRALGLSLASTSARR